MTKSSKITSGKYPLGALIKPSAELVKWNLPPTEKLKQEKPTSSIKKVKEDIGSGE